ncbi:methionine biosynthesis protein MetW [Magnetofaba australis]|uniref:Putative methionine biosynthesis protein MetW n=1 Tax=Magnetofaba australis IT-1 TaxID=1434232 RepID=A0A1Y2K4J9_9PROT|nr:methionine biosynthesis protein MetW [Magnetofaba australis]OSM02064.1 putative methionine biosynthesis protein MetW [Magnetofaba australis IT-1]
MSEATLRVDHEIIAGLVPPGSRVLDLGCGDGELLAHLIAHRSGRGLGVEISDVGVRACIRRGVPVFHGDIDQGLSDHPDNAFDVVILSHTLQTVRNPKFVLEEMLRVGKQAIVSFPNFGHWSVRTALMFGGRMPKTAMLQYEWYDTPNIHMCTIRDFEVLCRDMNARILKQLPLASTGRYPVNSLKRKLSSLLPPMAIANLVAPMAVFVLSKQD